MMTLIWALLTHDQIFHMVLMVPPFVVSLAAWRVGYLAHREFTRMRRDLNGHLAALLAHARVEGRAEGVAQEQADEAARDDAEQKGGPL